MLEHEKNIIFLELEEANNLIKILKKNLKNKERKKLSTEQTRPDVENYRIRSPIRDSKNEEKKIDLNRLKIPERLGTSSSPDRFEYNFTERDEDLSYKKICQEAMKIVGVGASRDLYSKLLHLKLYHSKYKKSKKLISRISEMIVQFTPDGTLKTKPTIQQIWKWITKLFEEYMKLKKSVAGEGFSKLFHMLNASSSEEVIEKVTYLQKKLKQSS